MRIQIFEQGGSCITDFCHTLANVQTNVNQSIGALNQVQNNLHAVAGGVNSTLARASESITARIQKEHERFEHAALLITRTNQFAQDVAAIDAAVAAKVRQEREAFFNQYQWLRPPAEKGWLEQKLEAIANAFTKAGGALKTAFDSVVAYVKDHVVEIIVGIVGIIIGVAATVATGVAVLTALTTILVSVAISVAVSAVISVGIALIFGGDAWKALGDGVASGFMWGGIFSGIFGLFKFVKFKVNPPTYSIDDVAKLTGTENCNADTIKHTFFGELKNGKAQGVHYNNFYNSANAPHTIKVGPILKKYPGGIYDAQVWVDGVAKTRVSTFFPKGWSPQQCLDAMNQARASGVYIQKSNTIVGAVKGKWFNKGFDICICLDKGHNMTNFFPIPK